MIKITQLKIKAIKLPVEKNENIVMPSREQKVLKKEILRMLHIKETQLKDFYIIKKSIDARKKDSIKYIYSLCVKVDKESEILKKNRNAHVTIYKPFVYQFNPCKTKKRNYRPIVIGSGPAGLFCALNLAQAGFAPIVLERGKCVRERIKETECFWETGKLNIDCNVQFGEGGAGTFSDGKLNTAIKDPTGRIQKVLDTFVDFGAPEEIKYLSRPHIGTDRLRNVIENIRKYIIQLGGEFRFDAQMTDVQIKEGKVVAVEVNHEYQIPCETVILAPGHSARDTFAMLKDKNIDMSAKAFAIGVRVEHEQKQINEAQFGIEHDIMPVADYKLTYQTSSGRGVYSFCMCPGGFVVNSSSEEGHLVVNGMSNYKRNEVNANSALIVTVTPEDFQGDSVLGGMEFQRKWEKLAFEAAGGKIPVQLVKDFRNNQVSTVFGHVQPCMKGQYAFANVRECLPGFVSNAILEGMEAFGKKIKGYYDGEALFSGVETRTSSPVRMIRNEYFESSVKGLYPCGEGAGYAGGITSAAIDGIKVAEAIRNKYK